MRYFLFSAASMFMKYTENADLKSLVDILMWVGRCLVLAVFGGTGVVKAAKGQADENPTMRNEGLILIACGGVLFAATFGIFAIFK